MDEIEMIVAKAIEFANYVSADHPARKGVALMGLREIARALEKSDPDHCALSTLEAYLKKQDNSSR